MKIFNAVYRKIYNILHKEKSLTIYSQWGEDRIIEGILIYLLNRNTNNLRYIDIGSNHPIIENNTYYFYKRGGKGVLIEPNPNFFYLTKHLRPRDTFINAGVSINDLQDAIYYDFGKERSGWNTFSEQRVKNILLEGYNVKQKFNLPLIKISDVLSEYFIGDKKIDILSIDVEGLDFEILISFDFINYRPTIVCIEANKVDKNGPMKKILKFMEDNNYLLVADTFINLIFVDKNDINSDDITALTV